MKRIAVLFGVFGILALVLDLFEYVAYINVTQLFGLVLVEAAYIIYMISEIETLKEEK